MHVSSHSLSRQSLRTAPPRGLLPDPASSLHDWVGPSKFTNGAAPSHYLSRTAFCVTTELRGLLRALNTCGTYRQRSDQSVIASIEIRLSYRLKSAALRVAR